MAIVVWDSDQYRFTPHDTTVSITDYFVAVIRWWRATTGRTYLWAWDTIFRGETCVQCAVPVVDCEMAMIGTHEDTPDHHDLVCFECVEVWYLAANPGDGRDVLLDPFRSPERNTI